MIQLHVPAEYADTVQDALTCETCGGRGGRERTHVGEAWTPCADCPPSFWWGVNKVPSPFGNAVLPADVAKMLDPCERCDGLGKLYPAIKTEVRCDDCRGGRPLVELVTDCPRPDFRGSLSSCVHFNCAACKATGRVPLGTVTVTELVSLAHPADDGAYIGPPDATHAVQLTEVTP
jgi:hypothetical protein